MLGFRRKKHITLQDESAFEREVNKHKLRRLDKVYIITAAFLLLGWGVWNFGGLNLSKLKLSSISNYFAERRASKAQDFMCWSDYYPVSVSGDYIFYYNYQSGGFYRMKRDGSENTQFLDEATMQFKAAGNWLYYVTPDKRVMKIRLDGTDKSEVYSAKGKETTSGASQNVSYISSAILMAGEFIYIDTNSDKIIKIPLKGGEASLIQVDRDLGLPFPYGNNLYYVSPNSGVVYKTEVGKEEKTQAFSLTGGYGGQAGIYKGFLYYLNQNRSLYRCRLDGTEGTRIDEDIEAFNIDNDSLYYSKNIGMNTGSNVSISLEFFKASPNGADKRQLVTGKRHTIYIKDNIALCIDPVYSEISFLNTETLKNIIIPEPEYTSLSKGIDERLSKSDSVNIPSSAGYANLYNSSGYFYYARFGYAGITRYNTSTGDKKLVVSDPVLDFKMLKDMIFYRSRGDGKLYISSADGSRQEKLLDFTVEGYIPGRNALYFTSPSHRLYQLQYDNGRITKPLGDERVYNLAMDGEYLYYSNILNNSPQDKKPMKLYRTKLDGTAREEMEVPSNIISLTISGGRVYLIIPPSEQYSSTTALMTAKFGEGPLKEIASTPIRDYLITGSNLFYRPAESMSVKDSGEVRMCSLEGKYIKSYYIEGEFYFIDKDMIYFIGEDGTLLKRNLKEFINKPVK